MIKTISKIMDFLFRDNTDEFGGFYKGSEYNMTFNLEGHTVDEILTNYDLTNAFEIISLHYSNSKMTMLGRVRNAEAACCIIMHYVQEIHLIEDDKIACE